MQYNTSDCIFANITSIYGSSVIVIRISGDFTYIAKALNILGANNIQLKHKVCFLQKLFIGDKFLDESLITYFKAPHSFTGQDCLEIAIHGSRFIFEEISKVFCSVGLRFALNGEFSYRAFLNGKMDLVQAEGMANLIASETSVQHKLASRRFTGEDTKTFEHLRSLILNVLANLESLIDFSDEDLPKTVATELTEKVEIVKHTIQSYLQNNSLVTLKEGIKLVIIGKPNAGKSSIFNMLCGKDKAIVSSIAGTTRDIIEEKIIVKGIPIILHDTAGIRANAKDEIEIEGIKRAIKLLNQTDIKVLVSVEENFEVLAKEFDTIIDENTILVQNKVDLIANIKTNAIQVCAINLEGKQELLNAIEKKVEENFLPLLNSALFVNEREKMLLENAYTFLSLFSLEKEIELAGEDLRQAVNSLSAIIGKIDVEEILGNIFGKFCIGK